MITSFAERGNLIRPYGKTPSAVQSVVFGDPLTVIGNRIRRRYAELPSQRWEDFMHPEDLKQASFLQTPEYIRGYCHFKYLVADVLQPKVIVEIGIGAGNSGIAMVLGAPESLYIGIDNNSKGREQKIDYTAFVVNMMNMLGVRHQMMIQDSKTVKAEELPHPELFHVDGGHDYESALSDCRLAFETRADAILIDDAHDKNVLMAAMDVYRKTDGYVWDFFADTFTGNLLFLKTGG